VNDDRISRALHQQADTITLPPPDPTGTMRRGTRRRTRRRAGLAGAVAVAGILATTVAVRSTDDPQQQLTLGSPSAVASTYQWSEVTPKTGLAWNGHTAQLADGSIYSISTAPGPFDPTSDQQVPPALYRSTDGAEWREATLPSGVRSSDLAGAGDTLYSVGTSPAGGMLLSSSTDRAASWSSLELPDDVRQLQARHPGQIVLGQIGVAARDADHLVVATTASTSMDLTSYRPEYTPDRYMWTWDPTGVTVYQNPQSVCTVDASGGESPAKDPEVCRTGKPERGPEVAHLTYDELGITGELREHVGGQAYVYAATDGRSFQRVQVPAPPQTPGDGFGWGSVLASPLAVADGFRLLIPGNDETLVLRSGDGTTWTQDTVLPGGTGQAGVLSGGAAVATWGPNGENVLRVQSADGTWRSLDLVGAAGGTSDSSFLEQVGFGPLGLAAVVSTVRDNENPTYQLVHTADGSRLEVKPLTIDARHGQTVTGVTVTADAIAVRITDRPDGDASTPPTQKVLVGTPQ
jgi:hypothetical protein